MMIKPGISELSKCVDSRYTLVTMAAKRARMIGEERMHDMDAYGDEKPVSVAAEEIVEGKEDMFVQRLSSVQRLGRTKRLLLFFL